MHIYRMVVDVGPTAVKHYASKLRRSGFRNVIEGTESVIGDVEAKDQLDAEIRTEDAMGIRIWSKPFGRKLRNNGTSMTFGTMPSLADFRRHLRSFTVDGERESITDADGSPVYKMELVGEAAKTAHHAADAVPGVRMRHGRKMQVSFDDVASLHGFLVSLAHHFEDGKEDAGDLASAMMQTLGYEWI